MGTPARSCVQLSVAAALVLGASSAQAFPYATDARANDVVGQADYATGFVDFDLDPFFGGATSRTRMFVPSDVAYDAANERVFVADVHNHRFLVFDASAGLVPDMAAAFVLGQPDFVTGGADPADPFGNENTPNPAAGCTTTVNACGVRRALAVAYDDANGLLFAADPDNHRVLVWDLAAGITNGMAARYVLGQASFTTDTRNTACGGGAAGAANACGLAFPSELAYDAASRRLYVADTDNHRVVVFDLAAGITNGMAATTVLGQPDLLTRTVNTACGGGASGAANACGLASPSSLSLDPAGRLFVADADNRRVTVFATTALVSGMAASRVLGQPNLTTATANTSCGGGASGEVNTNACGLGVFGYNVEYGDADDRLYVADTSNHRILVFDAAGVTNGEAAVGVLGQPGFTDGYEPAAVALGGATSRSRLMIPMGLAYDALNDRLIAADGGNHRLAVFGSNVGGEPVAIAGDDVTTTTTQNPNGSVTIDITTSIGDDFTVILPAGTTPLPGSDITITVDNQNGSNRPRIRVDAQLPPGTTKSITLPKSGGRSICVVDKTHATFTQHYAGSCAGTAINGPAQAGQCQSFTVVGDPGDNGDARGRHPITVCLDAGGAAYTLSGLLHTMLETMPADDELEDGGPNEAEPDDPEVGGTPGGCDAGGGQAPVGAALGLLLVALGVGRMRPVRSRNRRRA